MTKKSINEKPACPDCGSRQTITDYKHGEIICKCGLVLNDTLFNFGPETRAYDQEKMDKVARTGSPLKFAKQNLGLTTEIDHYDRDILGRSIPTERKAQLYRLRKWQRRARMGTSVDRNLSIALPELDRMCGHLNIPNNIKEECAQLYRKCVKERIVRGRSIESVVAAVIYLISRQRKLPKILDELESVSGVKKKDIGRSYRIICRRMKIRMPVTTAADYISRLASKAGVSGETQAKAIEILEKARKDGTISGRVPISMAAAGIYLAAEMTGDENAKQIKGISGVSEMGIKNRYNELKRFIDRDNGIEVLLEEEIETLDDMLGKVEKKKILLKFADELELSDETKKEAVEILEKVMENGFKLDPRKNINGYIEAAIYLSAMDNEKISLWKIEKVTKTSSTIIWDRKEKIKKALIGIEQ
ncbi:transcription initiation factor IIB [Candidatus Parcubacteria bacterium]|nr:transcription initiation factor IIB [Candidatus Parcubacteria bacterium]